MNLRSLLMFTGLPFHLPQVMQKGSHLRILRSLLQILFPTHQMTFQVGHPLSRLPQAYIQPQVQKVLRTIPQFIPRCQLHQVKAHLYHLWSLLSLHLQIPLNLKFQACSLLLYPQAHLRRHLQIRQIL